MTLTEFLSILNGEYKETAGTSAKNQCTDLANAYIKYVLGLPAIEWANAVDFPSKAGDKYEYILNSPTGVPLEGDLVIWGGTYGHIAIFLEGNTTRFTSFDENFPTGSPCHVQEHDYKNVLGWLHPKVAPQTNDTTINELRAQRDTNWNLYQAERNAKIDLETQIDQKNKSIQVLEKMVQDKEKDILSLQKSIQSLTDINVKLDGDNHKLSGDIVKTTMDLEICLAQRKDLGKYETKELITEIVNRIFKRR
jgi:hypothetical protein